MRLLYINPEKNSQGGNTMEAIRDFLERLKDGTFFIKGEQSTSYQVFRKKDTGINIVYGSGEEKFFHPRTEVIPIILSRFGQLEVCHFVLANSAKAPRGFIVPHNVMVKCPSPAAPRSHGQAIYINDGAHGHREDINNNERVFILQGIFHFQEVKVLTATLLV